MRPGPEITQRVWPNGTSGASWLRRPPPLTNTHPADATVPSWLSHPVQCRCGIVQGELLRLEKALHAVCYCRDCQTYAHALGEASRTLDAKGGTEVVATQAKYLRFSSGAGRLACVRLTETGILRWYASCCRTPLANTPRDMRLPYVSVPQYRSGPWQGRPCRVLRPDSRAGSHEACQGIAAAARRARVDSAAAHRAGAAVDEPVGRLAFDAVLRHGERPACGRATRSDLRRAPCGDERDLIGPPAAAQATRGRLRRLRHSCAFLPGSGLD